MNDDADEALSLLRWALQVIDDDLGWEVAQRKGSQYRRAKDLIAVLPEDDDE